jgi:hypothetical protein
MRLTVRHSDCVDLPVARIRCAGAGQWVLTLQGNDPERIFATPAEAQAFLAAQARGRWMIELQIGELYIAAERDPARQSLFVAD